MSEPPRNTVPAGRASAQLPLILSALRARGVSRSTLSVAESRQAFEGLSRVCPLAGDVEIEPVVAGRVPAEWLSCPEIAAAKALLFLHGGAYVIGSLASHRDLASRLGRAAGARVLSVGYRLAPEHRFPAALEDALAAYSFLLEGGVAPESTAIVGDSAGAGLGLALLLEARRLGWPLPAAWVGLSPSVDLEGNGVSFVTNAASDPVIEHRFLLETAAHYLVGHDRRDPRASPLYGELSGLPPLFIQVGSPETLLDDSRRLAQKAKAAGTEVELEIWDGMFHGWQLYARILPEGRAAIERVGEWLQGRLGR